MFMGDSLEDVGFLADEAGTAGEAMSKIENQTPPFAAVIIDVGLPDRPGDVLAGELRAKWAELPIIIASGHDEQELARKFNQDRFMGVLAKPYNSGMLLSALQKFGIVPTVT